MLTSRLILELPRVSEGLELSQRGRISRGEGQGCGVQEAETDWTLTERIE